MFLLFGVETKNVVGLSTAEDELHFVSVGSLKIAVYAMPTLQIKRVSDDAARTKSVSSWNLCS